MRRPPHKDRITVRRAKELCREKLGRLPRCGYEVRVEEGQEETDCFDQNGRHYRAERKFHTYLQNCGGTYRVWTWWDPFPPSWSGESPISGPEGL